MNPTFLTENGWKTICRDAKIKDTRLLQALAAYEGAGKDDLEGQLKELGTIGQVADGLKKNREVASNAEAAKYLRVDRTTIYRWERAGILRSYPLPIRGRRFKQSDLDALLESGGKEDGESTRTR